MGNHSSVRQGRRGRAGLAALAAGAVIVAFPATAWAHAEFVSNSSVPANSDQKLTLNVPEEKGPTVHNTKVVFVVPSGFSVSGCDTEAPVEVRGDAGQRRPHDWSRTPGRRATIPTAGSASGSAPPAAATTPSPPTRPTATTPRTGGTGRPTPRSRRPSSRSPDSPFLPLGRWVSRSCKSAVEQSMKAPSGQPPPGRRHSRPGSVALARPAGGPRSRRPRRWPRCASPWVVVSFPGSSAL